MEVSINRYFVRHPEMVLGAWSRRDTLYGEGYSVVGNGNLAEQLGEAIDQLPTFPPIQVTPVEETTGEESRFIPPPLERHINDGSFFVAADYAICQLQDGDRRAGRLWRQGPPQQRHDDRQAHGCAHRVARPGSPRAAIAE